MWSLCARQTERMRRLLKPLQSYCMLVFRGGGVTAVRMRILFICHCRYRCGFHALLG